MQMKTKFIGTKNTLAVEYFLKIKRNLLGEQSFGLMAYFLEA
ncbi:TPA: hypothetical protein ACKRG8_002673 [Proteus mirabilis]